MSEKSEKPDKTELRMRALRLQNILPSTYIDLAAGALPHLDNEQGRVRIRNVKTGKVADAEVLKVLETIALEYEKFAESLKA